MSINTNVPSAPPPEQNVEYAQGLGIDTTAGSTESSAVGKQTVGGQQANVKDKKRSQGTEGSNSVNEAATDTVSTKQVGQQSYPVGESKNKGSNKGGEDPADPTIPGPKLFEQVQVKVNSWLNSFYMTSLTVNLAQVAMTYKDIHKAEGAVMVKQLERVWAQSQAIAALIMAKAATEVAMHMALAITAVASLGVAVLGTAMSMRGSYQKASAEKEIAGMKDPNYTLPTTPGTGLAGSRPSVGSTTPTTTPSTPPAGAPPGGTNVRVGQQHAAAPAPAAPAAPAPPPLPPLPPVTVGGRPIIGHQRGGVLPSGGAPVSGAPARPTNAAHLNPPAGPRGPAPASSHPAAGTPDPKITREQQLIDKMAKGDSNAALGMGLTQSSSIVNSILENTVQAIFKPLIAQIEADTELARAVKDIALKALDSAMQAFSSAGDELTNVLKVLAQAIEESIKANSITRS